MNDWELSFKPPGSETKQTIKVPVHPSDRRLEISGQSTKLERGWTLKESLHMQIPNPNSKINYAGKRGAPFCVDIEGEHEWNLPSGWDYASTGRGKLKPGQAIQMWKPRYVSHRIEDTLLTGTIGHVTGINLVTDVFRNDLPPRKSQFVYALTKGKDNRGHHIVQAYLWERDNPERTYWYKFRSARLAHKHLKKYDAAKRTWSDMENE
jgi:hypothetical protein